MSNLNIFFSYSKIDRESTLSYIKKWSEEYVWAILSQRVTYFITDFLVFSMRDTF